MAKKIILSLFSALALSIFLFPVYSSHASTTALNGTYGIARMVAGFPSGIAETAVLAGRGTIAFNGSGSCSASLIDTEYGLDLSTGVIKDYSATQTLPCSYSVNTNGAVSLTFTGDTISYQGSVSADGSSFNLAGPDSATNKKVTMLTGTKLGTSMGVSSMNGTYGIARMVAGFPSNAAETAVLAGRGTIAFNGNGSCSASLIDTEYGLNLSTYVITDFSAPLTLPCSYSVNTNGGVSLTFTGDTISYQGSVSGDGSSFNLAGPDSATNKKVMMLTGTKLGTSMGVSSMNGKYGIARMVAGFPSDTAETMVLAGKGTITFNGNGSCNASLTDTEYGMNLLTHVVTGFSASLFPPCSYSVSTNGAVSLTFTGDTISYQGSVSGDGSSFTLAGPDSDTNKKVMMLTGNLLDTTRPVTTVSPPGGTYSSAQNITLVANEPATIYYTTNGSTPTISSSVYSGPIHILTSTILKLFAQDIYGNSETVKTVNYTLTPTCGAANGTMVTSAPATNLCAAGIASTVIGTGPWGWTCSGNIGETIASCSAQIQTWPLTALFAGTGGGSISGGISCTSGSACPSVAFEHGANVILYPTPDVFSNFGGWSGACTGTGNCSLTMTSAKSVTATFTSAPKAKVGTTGFATIQAAYNDASTQSGAIIKLLEGTLTENPIFNLGKAVTLEGGYNATYSGVSAETTIAGTLYLRAGTVRVKGVNVK